jgi:hypothetical protein
MVDATERPAATVRVDQHGQRIGASRRVDPQADRYVWQGHDPVAHREQVRSAPGRRRHRAQLLERDIANPAAAERIDPCALGGRHGRLDGAVAHRSGPFYGAVTIRGRRTRMKRGR